MGLMENGKWRIVRRLNLSYQGFPQTTFRITAKAVSSPWSVPFSIFLLLVIGCAPAHKELVDNIVLQPTPVFEPDSAYAHITAQVAFGPRIPGTETHARCGDYLVQKLNSYGAEVIEQCDSVTAAYGKRLPLRNIIAAFHPDKDERILLMGHWDSRSMADMDSDRPDDPFDSANDGASGVGVLLEVARIIGQTAPTVGVDIILFDTEDQGKTWEEGDTHETEFFFCLGARYWAQHSHSDGYTARYGVMLDMVGAADARFTLEQHSMTFAPTEMKNVWAIAHRLGYADRFPFNLTRAVQHDHYYISALTGIPTLAILHHDNATYSGYGSFWHAHSDNLGIIDRSTLKAAGQTVVQVLFNEGR